MITVREVSSKKDQKAFIDFPLNLYKGNPYFVPPIYGDEKAIFSPDYHYYETCEAVYYLAERDGQVVGRISGILQKASNEKRGEKRIRFTRFDAINDQEVADALFAKVEEWGRSKGMNTICGPLGFSDLEREGLLIEGFDQPQTYEEQYNYDYYQSLIEHYGFVKEVDWTESQMRALPEKDERLYQLADKLMAKYKLHMGEAKNVNDFIAKYADPIFALIDKSYAHLYGTVPITTPKVKQNIIESFKMVLKLKYIGVVLDENENVICLGICWPSLSKALQPSQGKLTPACIARLLWAINHVKVIDLALIGVDPEWLNKGVSAIIISQMDKMLRDNNLEYAETNLNLEENYAINNMWKRFDRKINKRRRSFVKNF